MSYYIHPDVRWIIFTINQILDEEYWLVDNIADVVEKLPYYLSDHLYVLSATYLLDLSVPLLMMQSRYDKIIKLCEIALETFDDDLQIHDIASLDPEVEKLLAEFGDTFDLSNSTKYAREYFRLKLHLAHAHLMSHNHAQATLLLDEILETLPDTIDLDRLDAYYILLKYYCYGYDFDAGFDLVHEATELTISKYENRRTDLYIAVAYFHYSKGNEAELKAMMDKIMRQMGKDIMERRMTPRQVAHNSAEQNYFLSIIYREQNDFDNAYKHRLAAAEQYAEVNNPERNMLMLMEKALWHTLKYRENPSHEEHAVAQQWMDIAYRDYHMLENKQSLNLAHLDHTQGLIYLNTKQYDKALEKLKPTLEIWQESKHVYNTALTHNAIGYTEFCLKNFDVAIKHYHQAESICTGRTEQHSQRLLEIIHENIDEAKQHLSL